MKDKSASHMCNQKTQCSKAKDCGMAATALTRQNLFTSNRNYSLVHAASLVISTAMQPKTQTRDIDYEEKNIQLSVYLLPHALADPSSNAFGCKTHIKCHIIPMAGTYHAITV